MALLKWLYPGIGIKRWFFLAVFGGLLTGVGLDCLFGDGVLIQFGDALDRLGVEFADGREFSLALALVLLAVGVVGVALGLIMAVKAVVAVVMPGYGGRIADAVLHASALKRGPSIVAIGGGTGLSTLLRGLKEHTSNITAIVTVTDDGGSSGRLRSEMGILPPGDIRNCLVALADKEPLMERLFQYRFRSCSGLNGHSFGNLLIAALTDLCGDFELAVKESSKVLAVRGRVLPSTLSDVTICAEMLDGSIVRGETSLSSQNQPIRRVFIEPGGCDPLPEALDAIREADAIVLGPGSLYTSVIPNLLVEELTNAIAGSSAPKIYVCNVMTQRGETDHYSVQDHVQAILDHSRRDLIDYCIVNDTPVSEHLIARYRQMSQDPVVDDSDRLASAGIRVVKASVVSETAVVRHDPTKLAAVLMQLIGEIRNHQSPKHPIHRLVDGLRARLSSHRQRSQA